MRGNYLMLGLLMICLVAVAACDENQTAGNVVEVVDVVSTVSETPIPPHTQIPTNTAEPTETPSPFPTATETSIPTETPTPSPTLLPTPTPIGGQLRAYAERFIYFDDGHSTQTSIKFPETRLALHGTAYFPAWSPDYSWIVSLHSNSRGIVPATSDQDRVERAGGTLIISKPDGSESRELARLSFPEISNLIQETDSNWMSFLGRYNYDGGFIAWSPDGRKIAYLNYIGRGDDENLKPLIFEIMVVDIDGGEPLKIGETTFSWIDTAFDMRPFAWSPDSSQIAFTSYGNDDYGLHLINEDGSGHRRILETRFLSLPMWLEDGQSILVQKAGGLPSISWLVNGIYHPSFTTNNGDLWQIDLDGTVLRELGDGGKGPIMSPDRSKVAYISGDTVVVLNLEDLSRRIIANVCGNLDNHSLLWSPDSKFIAFETEQVLYEGGQIDGCSFGDTQYTMVFSIDGEAIATLPITSDAGYDGRPLYDFSPDSQWLAITARAPEQWPPSIVILNLLDGSVQSSRTEAPRSDNGGSIEWSSEN